MLTETIIFEGNPENAVDGNLQLPPQPQKTCVIRNKSEIFNLRRNDSKVCDIQDLLEFLPHVWTLMTDTKRALNSYHMQYLNGRVSQLVPNGDSVVSWAQFSKAPVDVFCPRRMRDGKERKQFSFASWIWKCMEYIRGQKDLQKLWEAGLLILFADRHNIQTKLVDMKLNVGNKPSLAIKFACSRRPDSLTLSYYADGDQNHASVCVSDLVFTVRDLGKVTELSGINKVTHILGWSKEDPESMVFFPKSSFEETVGHPLERLEEPTIRARKIVDAVDTGSRKEGLNYSGQNRYYQYMMRPVLPISSLSNLNLNDTPTTSGGDPSRGRSMEEILSMLEAGFGALERANSNPENSSVISAARETLIQYHQRLSRVLGIRTDCSSSGFESDEQHYPMR